MCYYWSDWLLQLALAMNEWMDGLSKDVSAGI